MKPTVFVFLLSALISSSAFAATVDTFRNEHFSVAMPEGFVTVKEVEGMYGAMYGQAKSAVAVGRNEAIDAGTYFFELQKEYKENKLPVWEETFWVDGCALTRLTYLEQQDGEWYRAQIIAFDNHMPQSVGTPQTYFVIAGCPVADSTAMKPVFDQCFASLRFNVKRHESNDFSLEAPTLAMLYYVSGQPVLEHFGPSLYFSVVDKRSSYNFDPATALQTLTDDAKSVLKRTKAKDIMANRSRSAVTKRCA